MEEKTSFFNKVKTFFIGNKKEAVFIVIVILIFEGTSLYKDYKNGDLVLPTFNKTTPQKVVQKEALPKNIIPKCTKTEIDYVLKSNDNLMSGKDFLVVDLNTFEKTATKIKYGKEYNYYQRFGREDLFITIAKKIKKVEDNNTKK